MSVLTLKQTISNPSHFHGVAAEEGAGGCADMSWMIRGGRQLHAQGSVWHTKKMEVEFNSAGYVFNHLGKQLFLNLNGVTGETTPGILRLPVCHQSVLLPGNAHPSISRTVRLLMAGSQAQRLEVN